MKTPIPSAAFALVVLVGCGGAGDSQTPVTQTVTGEVAVDSGWDSPPLGDLGDLPDGDECTAPGLDPGRGEVVVKDGTGNTIANGELSAGQVKRIDNNDRVYDCIFEFRIEGVPETDFYEFSIGVIPDTVTMSKGELASQNGHVELTIDLG